MHSILLALALATTNSNGQPRVITVAGEAKLTYRPNQVVATFVVPAAAKDAVGVKKISDEKIAKILKACRDAGVEQRNIMITENSVVPEYRGNEVVGQQLSRALNLTITDMGRIDEALTAAVRNGAQPQGVYLQNTERLTWETKARVAAAAVAKERAKGEVEALGAKLGLPLGITDHTTSQEMVSAGTFSVPAEGPVVTAFASRELSVSSQVSAQFDVEAP